MATMQTFKKEDRFAFVIGIKLSNQVFFTHNQQFENVF